MTPWAISAALAAIIAVGAGGYVKGGWDGAARCEARHAVAAAKLQRELFTAADRMSEQAAEIETFRATQALLIEDLENAANADPGACRLSDDARLRLKARWGEPLDAAIAAPCAHPSVFLNAGPAEVVLGRIGDALILCGKRHAAAVGYAVDLGGIINGPG